MQLDTRARLPHTFGLLSRTEYTWNSVPLDFLGDLRRTHTCGELRASDAGKRAVADGLGAPPPRPGRRDLHPPARPRRRDPDRVPRRRRPGGPRARPNCCASEYVVAVEGLVELRTPETINPTIPTGEVEVVGREALDPERLPHAAVPHGRERGREAKTRG